MVDVTIPKFQEVGYAVAFASRMDNTAVSILVATAFVSLFAVLALLITMGVSTVKSSATGDRLAFVKNHIVVYFVCLLFCWIIQCFSAITSIQWLQDSMVTFGSLCTIQGGLKHFANVGTAVWTVAIAAQIFCVLYLEFQISNIAMWTVLIVGWVFSGFMVAVGPLLVGRGRPFYGVAGLRCGVSPEFELQGLLLEEMIMLLAIFLSVTLCFVTFLRVRGFIGQPSTASDKTMLDTETKAKVSQMLPYPLIYAGLSLPIVIIQYVDYGFEVPLEYAILGSCVYLLTGLINAVVFAMTRRMLPSILRSGGNSVARSQGSKSVEDQAERGVSKTVKFATDPTVIGGKKEVKRPRPLDLAFRNSFDSMYTMREGQHVAPLSSHWSPDTPPLYKKRGLSGYLQSATSIAQRMQM